MSLSEDRVFDAPQATLRDIRDLLLDCGLVFLEPAKVFVRRKSSPVILPMTVIICGCIAAYYLYLPLLEPAYLADFRRGVAAKSVGVALTAEQLQSAFATNMKIGGLFNLVTIPLTILSISLAVWSACAVVGVKQSYARALVVATWSYLPHVAQVICQPLTAIFRPESGVNGIGSLALGVTFFLDPLTSSDLIYALLLRVELFTLWSTVLVGVGIVYVSQVEVKKANAVVVAVMVFLLGYLPTLSTALR